jgi:hypothetical protein
MKRFAAAMTMLAVAGGAAPAAASSEQSAAAKAVAGRMLAAPRSEALVKQLPVRVAVRVPARTRRLRVRVGDRDVTARFRRTRGSLRVANLTRGDGLQYGHNHLVVLAERRGGRPVIDARSFVLTRRDAGLARLRVRPGPVTSLNVQVARGAGLAPEHFGRPRELERRLSVIGRERTLRVWLNGRRVTRAVDRSRPTRWTASLSTTHGLRYGINRLRILVAEPGEGRHLTLRRGFVVRRSGHLASAGWDTATRVGGAVRLDGRHSRTARGERPVHRWRIVSKPRGSHAKLRRAGSVRPVLTPDRRGRYVVALTVTSRTKRATASQVGGSGVDTVAVTAGPVQVLVPFKGLTVQDGHPGIQVGGTFYPNPSGAAMQWLTLDRRTLTPTGPGNSWLDGTGSGDHGIGALTTALAAQDVNQLVILSFPSGGGPGPPVQRGQNDAFNGAMKTLGVGPIDAKVLQDHNKLVIVGVPGGGDGSGRYTHGGGKVDALTGWLMPDAVKDRDAFRFRVQPERPAFDTSSSSTPTTNTMTVRDQRIDGALPAGATGGFQVVKLDPIDFTPVDHAVFATDWAADPGGQLRTRGLDAMGKYLNDNGNGVHVAVQSIGHVSWGPDLLGNWYGVGVALSNYGANPHIFNTVNGSYAFLGGPWLEKSEVADSSSAVVLDPVENKRESGTLRGRASMRADGYFMPLASDPTDSFEFSLYDTAFRSPTPWPYTAAGTFPQQDNCPAPGNDTAAYAAALSYIAAGIHLPATLSDIRSAYVQRDQSSWSDEKVDLSTLPYQSGHGFGQAEFCNLSAQLQREFDWLDKTKKVFDTYKAVLGSSGDLELADLQRIGQRVRTAVDADSGANVGWSVGGFVGNLISAALVLDPDGAAALAAWEMLVDAYELVRELVSGTDASAKPVGDQVSTKVEDLSQQVASHLSDSANALVRLRDVIISDYGRLQELGTKIESTGADVDPPTMTADITTAASAFFSSELVPIVYGVHALIWKVNKSIIPLGWPDDCTSFLYPDTWRGTPGSAQIRWMGNFTRDGYHQSFPTMLALGRHSLSVHLYSYPPKEVTDPMFTPSTRKIYGQNGYGMQLSRFMWEQYEKGFPPTDIFVCE